VADAVFVDGVPAKITIHDFRRHHLQLFPDLEAREYDDLIADAVDAVYAMFPGVAELWDWKSERHAQIWFDKTTLCYRLLTAWLIQDRYPELASNYTSLNGVRLEQKKVDGVMLKFQRDHAGEAEAAAANPLAALRSNDFGRKALLMIQSAAKRALLRNCRFV